MLRSSVLVLVACLTMASEVHAQEFHLETVPGYLTAEATATFENASNESKIKCGKVTYQATLTSATTKQVKIAAQFLECWLGGTHTEVWMNGCFFLWNAPAEAGKVGAIQISCEGGTKIEITVGLCTAKAAPQTPGGGATYANFGSGSSRDFVATIDAGGLQYEFSGLNCNATFGSGKDGRLTTTPTVRGFSLGSFVGAWVA